MNECPFCGAEACGGTYPYMLSQVAASRNIAHWRNIHDKTTGKKSPAPIKPKTGVDHTAEVKRARSCRWLLNSKGCGCLWGKCMHSSHPRYGEEVGFRDCRDCLLWESQP